MVLASSPQVDGYKFKRQIPIDPYIVDFACLRRKLVIEVDGGQHAENRSDEVCDRYLQDKGFRVLRFWNTDVLTNTEGVLEVIMNALVAGPSPGALRAPPSPCKRGEGKASA